MPTTPPRRPRRSQPKGESSLPIIPIFIAVIVLGFVIGAGFSLLGHRDGPVVVTSTSSPSQEPTDPPVVLVTPAPTEKPTPEPTDEPTEKPTPTPKPTPTRAPTPVPTESPDDTPSPVDEATVSPAASAEPSSSPRANGRPEPSPSAAPSVAAAGDPAFTRLSSDVVRQYLLAVAHGDDAAAYAALGASPGDRGASLTEAGVIDTKTHIGRADAQAAADGNVIVTVPLQTTMGSYLGTYTVRRNDTGAAVIIAHTLSKS